MSAPTKNRKSISPGQIQQILGFVRNIIEELALGFAQVQRVINDPERVAEFKEAIKPLLVKFFARSVGDLALSLDPVDILEAWTQLWQKWDPKGIHNIVVPELPYDSEHIQREKDRGRGFIYLPSQLATVQALADLGKLFPKMQSWSVSGNDDAKKIKNTKDLSGWLSVEMALNMPNPDTTEAGLREIFSQQNAEGKTLNVYTVFGQFCREVLGQYPDIPGYVRLLGSSSGGRVLFACFREDGDLRVDHDWNPDGHDSDVGGRSVAV